MLLLFTFAVLPPAPAHGWLWMHSIPQCGVELIAWHPAEVIVYMHTRPDFVVVVEGAWKSATEHNSVIA